MTGDPSSPGPPPSAPESPPPPPPGASRQEWHAWRHQQRDYVRSQWMHGGGYGPWGWRSSSWGWFWGLALVLAGVYYLLSNLGMLSWLKGDVLFPSLLILLGVVLLVRGRWGRW